MDFEEFEKILNEELKDIKIELNKEQVVKFYEYMNLLIEWNSKINLTAIIEPKEIILKHFIDSLTINQHVKDAKTIADIGTGAGFPGIPLKIANENIEITLIDSLNKRVNFLNTVIEKEKLDKIEALHARVEEIGHNKMYREKFDVVTSRAVAKLNVLAEYMLPFVKVGGKCICLKGPNVYDEIDEAKNAMKILGGEIESVEELVLPHSDIKRTIIIIKCVEQLPNKYPRKPGTPSIDPL